MPEQNFILKCSSTISVIFCVPQYTSAAKHSGEESDLDVSRILGLPCGGFPLYSRTSLHDQLGISTISQYRPLLSSTKLYFLCLVVSEIKPPHS